MFFSVSSKDGWQHPVKSTWKLSEIQPRSSLIVLGECLSVIPYDCCWTLRISEYGFYGFSKSEENQLKTVVLSHYHIRIWWSQVCANDFSMEKNTFHISSMEPKFMLNTTLSMVPIVSQLCGLSYSTSTMVAWVLNIWGKGLFGVWYDVSVVPTCWLWLLCDITT